MFEEKDQTLIFMLACHYERLYEAASEDKQEFSVAVSEFSRTTGFFCTNLLDQLHGQEKQRRDIFESPDYSAPERWTNS
jgi:hypothetical protein